MPNQVCKVFVAGAGVMGVGITQVVAQYGHPVWLYDADNNKAQLALDTLEKSFERLIVREKMTPDEAASALSRTKVASTLADANVADIVIEAVVEDLDEKTALFQLLEEIVSKDCVLATNTSSLSITRIGKELKHPERLVGMHFFNPAPVMKLVEIVSGLQTSPFVAEKVFRLAKSWDKIPVSASSTPGFIVNRIARPFYAEALALLQERVIEPEDLDRCVRSAGFRMGPCELMDLIGHDTNYQVTSSIFEANYFDRRYVPSQIQKSLVDAGFLGRKSGRGFFDYSEPSTPKADVEPVNGKRIPNWSDLELRGSSSVAHGFSSILTNHGICHQRILDVAGCELKSNDRKLRLTDGRLATQIGVETAVFDLNIEPQSNPTIAFSVSSYASQQFTSDVTDWLHLFGYRAFQIDDAAGLVVARIITMLINEAADAVQQGVCGKEDADLATMAGLNYPAGPFEWLERLGVDYVANFIENLDQVYRGERYRVSPWLLKRRNVQ